MKILDTDTLTLFFSGHERVVSRRQMETDEVAITIISRIETLQGRFAMVLKAADGAELRRAQQGDSDTQGIRTPDQNTRGFRHPGDSDSQGFRHPGIQTPEGFRHP